MPRPGARPSPAQSDQESRRASHGGIHIPTVPTATLMAYIGRTPRPGPAGGPVRLRPPSASPARSARPAQRAPCPVRAPSHAAGGPGPGHAVPRHLPAPGAPAGPRDGHAGRPVAARRHQPTRPAGAGPGPGRQGGPPPPAPRERLPGAGRPTLAREPCAARSHEIKAIPRLLDRLVLEGAVVTIDAAGCQTAIVQALRAGGADCVLAVKRNQPTLHREVKAAFDDAERGAFAPEAEARDQTFKHNRGRTERRTGTVLGGPGLCEWVADPKAWPGLRSRLRVRTERTGPRGRRTRTVRYYIPAVPRTRAPCWSWSAATGTRERPAPHPGRAVPGGRRPHPHGPRARRDGHPPPGRPEQGAHGSTESQIPCVHRAAARPHRTPTPAAGPKPALNPTLRLPCQPLEALKPHDWLGLCLHPNSGPC